MSNTECPIMKCATHCQPFASLAHLVIGSSLLEIGCSSYTRFRAVLLALLSAMALRLEAATNAITTAPIPAPRIVRQTDADALRAVSTPDARVERLRTIVEGTQSNAVFSAVLMGRPLIDIIPLASVREIFVPISPSRLAHNFDMTDSAFLMFFGQVRLAPPADVERYGLTPWKTVLVTMTNDAACAVEIMRGACAGFVYLPNGKRCGFIDPVFAEWKKTGGHHHPSH
jgi:hypothetical protein